MTEFYYESEVSEIMKRISTTTLGQYGIQDGQITRVDRHRKTMDLKDSLHNNEMQNPLIDYKAYLLYESLFIFDWINEYDSFLVGDVPIPLYCFKRGSTSLQNYWHSQDLQASRMKTEYYNYIKDDKHHLPSNEGELAELEQFFKYMRGLLDLEYVDSQLRVIGLSYDRLVDHVLISDWRSHDDVARWNRVYSAEDWMQHSVL